MPSKSPTAAFYTPKDVELVRSACLTLATYLGSFLEDVVIVGGLVPNLLIPTVQLGGREAHVGTRDLDLGLSLALLEEARYVELVEHLRGAGFEPDVTSGGGPANHRWKHREEKATVDFLIAPTEPAHAKTKVRVIEASLSAVLAKGLPLAFLDRRSVTVSGKTLRGEDAARDVWVCGAGAFVVLKALAFRGRGENKDAYDLYYLLENFGQSYVTDVADALRPLLVHEAAREALAILEADFAKPNAPGPRRAGEFLSRSDAEFFADRAGSVRELLRLLLRAPLASEEQSSNSSSS
jgi:hypothetical protein